MIVEVAPVAIRLPFWRPTSKPSEILVRKRPDRLVVGGDECRGTITSELRRTARDLRRPQYAA